MDLILRLRKGPILRFQHLLFEAETSPVGCRSDRYDPRLGIKGKSRLSSDYVAPNLGAVQQYPGQQTDTNDNFICFTKAFLFLKGSKKLVIYSLNVLKPPIFSCPRKPMVLNV